MLQLAGPQTGGLGAAAAAARCGCGGGQLFPPEAMRQEQTLGILALVAQSNTKLIRLFPNVPCCRPQLLKACGSRGHQCRRLAGGSARDQVHYLNW